MFNDEPDCGQVHSIYESETERKKCEPSLLFEKDSGVCPLEKGSDRPVRAVKDFCPIPKHLLSLPDPVLCRTMDLHSSRRSGNLRGDYFLMADCVNS